MQYQIVSNAKQSGVTLDLIYGRKGNVLIIARDAEGKKLSKGNILSLTKDGKVKRYLDVNPEIGFKLNSKGQVALHKN